MHKTPNNHPDADEHKGNAEPLAHVEGHVALKVDLDVFQELDADARAEDDDEEGAEHQAGLLVAEVALVVHPQQNAHRHEAEESLVKARRMAGQPFTWWTRRVPGMAGRVIVERAAELLRTAQEDKTPWQQGGRAVNLMVHHVAHTDQCPDEAYRHHNAVENPDVADTLKVILLLLRFVVVAHIKPKANQDADGAAVAGQTAFPNGKHLQWVGQIIIRLIEQAMTKASTDDSGHQHVNQQFIHPIIAHLLVAVYLAHNEIANKEAQGPQQAVPANLQRPQMNQDGVDVPSDII